MKTKLITTIMIMLFLASMLSMAFVAPVAADFPSDLRGKWHFDEGAGKVAYDSSGYGNDGLLSGGRFGGCLSFDGVNDYVNVPDNPTLDITGDITLEAWILIKGFSTSEGLHMYIVAKDSAAGRSYGIGVDLTWERPNTPFVIIFHPGGTYKIAWGTTALSTGTWYHIAGVFDATNDWLRLYVNGIPQLSEVDTSTIYSGPADLQIGARQYVGARCFFNGLIDEVRISDTVRYPGVFTPPTTPFSPDGNTKGLWHFDEGSGQTAGDATGVNNGRLGSTTGPDANDPTWVTVPTWVAGKFGKALSFDGYAYVQVAHSASMDVSDYYTFEAWVYLTDDSDYRGLFRRGTQGVLPSEIEIYIHPGWAGRKLVVAHNRPTLNFGYRYFYTPFPLNQWVHLAVTWDGTTARAYYNGVEQTVTGGTTMVDPAVSDKSSFIGLGYYAAYTLGNTPYMIGLIDEVRIWSRALSAPEVAASFGLGDQDTHPVQIKEKDLDEDGYPDVIFNSALYELSDGESITVWIVPIDTSITEIDYATVNSKTPRTTNGYITPETAPGVGFSVTFTVYEGDPPSKTLHIWIYLTDGTYTGEHVGFNAQFVR